MLMECLAAGSQATPSYIASYTHTFHTYCTPNVVDRHRFDADPVLDPNFHVENAANLERHQNDADLHVNPIPSFTHVGRSEFLFLSFTAMPVHNVVN
jgi:hypothetical protein